MDFVSGEILTKDGFTNGYLGFNKKKIIETGRGPSPKKPICKGLIIPTFVNAHTHIGDSFVRDKNITLPKNIEKLVAPPNGLKHRLLHEASNEDIIEGMEKSIDIMIKSGTSFFCDFRENGILGISQLKSALKLWKIKSLILSRPDSLEYNKDEIDIILRNSDGIGISSISDWDFSELKKVAKQTKQKNKIFSLHASERIRENIDDILDLKPNFVVHMLKAKEADLIKIKDENIPLIICPRSNSFFGMQPNYKLLKKNHIKIIIGTDNVMVNTPIMFEEIKYIRSVTKEFTIFDLLYMTTFEARKVLNLDCDILGSNSQADFVVLDKKTLKPLYISVCR